MMNSERRTNNEKETVVVYGDFDGVGAASEQFGVCAGYRTNTNSKSGIFCF